MQTTTQAAVRDDAIAQILLVTPSHLPQRGRQWKFVDHLPPGGGPLRLFTVEISAAEPTDDGFFGDGLDFNFEVRIGTSYRGVKEHEWSEFVTADGIDIWNQLRPRIDPELTGVFGWTHEGFEEGTDEEPFWGFHIFIARFLAATG